MPKELCVHIRVGFGSELSSLLFIIVLGALLREFRSGIPWEDLYSFSYFMVGLNVTSINIIK